MSKLQTTELTEASKPAIYGEEEAPTIEDNNSIGLKNPAVHQKQREVNKVIEKHKKGRQLSKEDVKKL